MKGIENLKVVLGLLSVSLMLVSCGGDDDDSPPSPVVQAKIDEVVESPNAPDIVIKEFTVELSNLVVQRISNGESVAVDVAGVTSNGIFYPSE